MRRWMIAVLMTLTLLMTSLLTAQAAAPITLNAAVDSTNRHVTITGTLAAGEGGLVTVIVLTAAGSTDYLDQTLAGASGKYAFSYTLDETVSGAYSVFVGGATVANPVEASFTYDSTKTVWNTTPTTPTTPTTDTPPVVDPTGNAQPGGTPGAGTTLEVPAATGAISETLPTAAYSQVNLPTYITPSALKVNFQDLSRYGWASTAIRTLAERGIVNGVSTTAFAPANKVKRADFLVMLVKALKLEATPDKAFEDVPTNAYYAKYVGIAQTLGITNGVDGKHFLPNAEISRQDLLVLTMKALQVQGKLPKDKASISLLSGFADQAQIASYARESLALAVRQGILKGSSNNRLNPGASASRAEVAVILNNILTAKDAWPFP